MLRKSDSKAGKEFESTSLDSSSLVKDHEDLISKIKLFQKYPHLISKSELAQNFPWYHTCRKVQCLDWFGIALQTFSSNLLVSYYELKEYPLVFQLFTIINISFAIFTYFITYTALQNVYTSGKHSSSSNSKNHKQNNILITLQNIIESYLFRTIIAISYAAGALIAWCVGYSITGVVNDNIGPIVTIYCVFGAVIFCIFDIPEGFLPEGTVDIIGSSHQLFHGGIVLGYCMLWSFYFGVGIK
eukprot:gene12211-25641_t